MEGAWRNLTGKHFSGYLVEVEASELKSVRVGVLGRGQNDNYATLLLR
jgi:hypothetical protein